MYKTDRRNFILKGAVAGALGIFASTTYARRPTPRETAGPFYPVSAQKDKDFDLTQVAGQQGVAKGENIIIQGQILDTDDNPIEDATVEIWQANANGRYRHPHDSNKAPLDPNFQGWAIVPSGKDGSFRFKTVYPGSYPASYAWTRPPHIHFKASKKGYIEIVTQMYFPGHKLNDADLLLLRKSIEERKLMIAAKVHEQPVAYQYTIVLQRA